MPIIHGTTGMYINNVGPFVYALDITSESIDVAPMTETHPDPSWHHVDSSGHFHAFDILNPSTSTPTLLDSVSENEHFCQDCEEHHKEFEVKYKCILCSEEVFPKYITISTSFRRSVPGKTLITFMVEDFTLTLKHLERVSFQGDRYFGIAHFLRFGSSSDKSIAKFQCIFLAQRQALNP